MSEAMQIVWSRSHDTFIHYKFIGGGGGGGYLSLLTGPLEAFSVTQKNMIDHHQK